MWKEVVPGKQGVMQQSLPLKEQGENCVLRQKHQVADEFPCEFGTLSDSPWAWGEHLRLEKKKCSFLSLPCHFSCVLLVSSFPWVSPLCLSVCRQ